MKRLFFLIAISFVLLPMLLFASGINGGGGGATGASTGNVTASGAFTAGHAFIANSTDGTAAIDGGTLATYTDPGAYSSLICATALNQTGTCGLIMGTMSDGSLCSYTSSGTLLNCNVATPASNLTGISDAQTLTNKTMTGDVCPTYTTASRTGTQNINIDGASYCDYTFGPGSGTAGAYTTIFTSPPGAGKVRNITLTLVGGTNGITSITWTGVTAIGSALATSVTATKTSVYACIIDTGSAARCKAVAENY